MTDGPQTPESAISSQTLNLSSPETKPPLNNPNPPQTSENPSSPSMPPSNEAQQIEGQTSSSPTKESEKETKLTNQTLINFLEKQKYPTSENQSLPLDQQEVNRKVDELIKSLNQNPDQPITQETFFQGLNFAYQKNLPEEISQIETMINQLNQQEQNSATPAAEKEKIREKIKFLNEILTKRQALLKEGGEIPEEVRKQIETVFGKLEQDSELKEQLIANLNNGSFDEVVNVFLNKSLQEKAIDSEETKQEKSRARIVMEKAKKLALPIGGVFGILLLLMILQAAKSGGGHGQMG